LLVPLQFEPNPFHEGTEDALEPASVGYRYRKFTLGEHTLIARCELHGWLRKQNEDHMMTAYALNEWDSKYCDGIVWRQKIDQQRGAVLATELKNNSCKLAKWTAQSMIAGADQMRVGYVSRANVREPNDHVILATQFFKPKELGQQINLSVNNVWGIIKMIFELIKTKEDGKFVLLKDPNKPTMRLYSVPINAFDDEEGEGEGEGEGEEGEGEEAVEGFETEGVPITPAATEDA
jgi:translation initiation factor 3 subunit D